MTTEFKIIIHEGKLTPPDVLRLRQAIDNLLDGSYMIRIKKCFRKASKEQFGYLFGLVHKEFQKALLSQGWEAENIKDVEQICKQLFSSKEITNRNTGEVMTIPESRSKFTTTEMMAYVDSIRNYSAENLGYYIEEPDPLWRDKL